jgi:hypothetical protein
MKKVYSLLTFVLISCHQNINIKSYNKVVNVEYGQKALKNDTALFKFMDGFADSVKVLKNDNLVYSGYIKTDESLSFAGLVQLKNLKKKDKIIILFDSEKIELEYQPKFPQLEIYNLENKLKLNFSKISPISNLE